MQIPESVPPEEMFDAIASVRARLLRGDVGKADSEVVSAAGNLLNIVEAILSGPPRSEVKARRPWYEQIQDDDILSLYAMLGEVLISAEVGQGLRGFFVDLETWTDSVTESLLKTVEPKQEVIQLIRYSRLASEVAVSLASRTATQTISRFQSQVAADVASVAEAKETVAEAAGDVATSQLATEFDEYAKRQMTSNWVWLSIAVLGAAAGVFVAVLLLRRADQAFSWYVLASHVLLALPSFAVAAYFSRQASRYREAAQWAHRLAVQLKSIRAYVVSLNEAPAEKSGTALMAAFGSFVYGPHTTGTPTDNDQIATIPPEAWAIISKAVETGKAAAKGGA